MSAPRLVIDLDKIQHNARTLVDLLAEQGIAVMGVTKATLGCPDIVRAMLAAGISALGDSRIENIEAMRSAKLPATMTLIRTPMISQADRVVRHADASLNSEQAVVRSLSHAAKQAGRTHGIVLMVELGDLREGLLPDDLIDAARETLRLPHLSLRGIGTNLACRSGVMPDADNMGQLTAMAQTVETTFGLTLDVVSGGNSASLRWALNGAETGLVNELRLGEAILLGCDPLDRQPIDGLHTDAIKLLAEVIESKVKPSLPWGERAQAAFGLPFVVNDRGHVSQTILAIGRQDIDPCGIFPPEGLDVMQASSDHLLLESKECLSIGSEISFQLNYSALLRAMTSPFVSKVTQTRSEEKHRTFEVNHA